MREGEAPTGFCPLFRIVAAIASLLFLFIAFAEACWSAPRLVQSPFDLRKQQRIFHKGLQAYDCPLVVTLPSRLPTVKLYTDAANSLSSSATATRFRDVLAPIVGSEDALSRMVGYLSVSPDAVSIVGPCIEKHLVHIAEQRLFLESSEFAPSGGARLLATTPILAYVAASSVYRFDDGKALQIRNWIKSIANLIVTWEIEFPYGNNISYWGGAALALAAVALDDPIYLTKAIEIAKSAMLEIDERGLLPREMTRGDRSLEYNLFATQALTLIAITANANGEDLFRFRGGAFLRLMTTLRECIDYPAKFIQLGGSQASIARRYIYRQNFAWMVILYAYTKDDAARRIVCQNRPLYSFRAGGDWFELFGDPNICKK